MAWQRPEGVAGKGMERGTDRDVPRVAQVPAGANTPKRGFAPCSDSISNPWMLVRNTKPDVSNQMLHEGA